MTEQVNLAVNTLVGRQSFVFGVLSPFDLIPSPKKHQIPTDFIYLKTSISLPNNFIIKVYLILLSKFPYCMYCPVGS